MTRDPDPLRRDQAAAARIVGPDGQPFAIPAEGTLGLLALGAVGLLAWRKRRGQIASSFVKTDSPPPRKGPGQGKERKKRGRKARKGAADGPQAGQ